MSDTKMLKLLTGAFVSHEMTEALIVSEAGVDRTTVDEEEDEEEEDEDDDL
jgi:hypothetical protein